MRKFFNGFKFALSGLMFASKTQLNIKVQLFAAVIVVVAGFLFKISFSEWLAITICTGCVLAAELLNTSIEALVDLVSPEFNPKAGLVKDIAAAAVLVAALIALTVALIIFIPKIF